MDWDSLDEGKYRDEAEAIGELLQAPPLSTAQRSAVVADAEALVVAARERRPEGVVESFLAEYSLGTAEGLALMCLAEALLRTPDEATRDALIAEQIGSADWAKHLGASDNLFVNASTWGLMLTGRLVEVDEGARGDIGGFITRLAGRLGEPVIRAAVAQAIRIMGEQFVLGRTIERALARAETERLLCSFDMLGEGARTAADAERYEQAYSAAIEAAGHASAGAGPEAGHGVSVKLSALSPRYEATQGARVWRELYPRLLRLAAIAAGHNLNFTIDGEEADRLVLSLKLLARLCEEPGLSDWQGLGLAVQAYQKRAPAVIASIADLARGSGRRLMVRLVKGAYWDTEIKRAEVAGRPDYPVFTTKAATDLCYLASAGALIEAAPAVYPQFATHNAHTLAAVHALAVDKGATIEFQRLHGMGWTLYEAAAERYGRLRLRVYAPVGEHEDLLPYLVRRLLENGANTSFARALTDTHTPPSLVAADPIRSVEAHPDRHRRIPKPADLYGPARHNSAGIDLSQNAERRRLVAAVAALDAEALWTGEGEPVRSPTDGRVVGRAREATSADIEAAIAGARAAQGVWDASGGAGRATVLRRIADAVEANRERLIAILAREGGKTLGDGVAEVREAADFCRYYAMLAERDFAGPVTLDGPVGEANWLERRGRGVIACVSPWNFPLSIFLGQITAALAAGNAVVAKPAEQTPLIASATVSLCHAAGLDPRLLALAPGRGEVVGAALISHPGVDGIAFTGGTDTARVIATALAARDGPIIPFVAETGGLNGMFVDTSALREQVIDDAMLSAFGSAGQRCSALRVLFLPHETADAIIAGLGGAMDALVIGDPADPATDVGPVIDAAARQALQAHLERLRREATVIKQLAVPLGGTFFGPVLAEIPGADFLEREVFGPILHIVRYDTGNLEATARALAGRRYGLTLGVHTRVERFSERVRALVPAGNVYVNRSMIGAVVGVQPFGGEGLSGTGPKAGGPWSLIRFAIERAVSVNIAAQGGDPALLNLGPN